MGREATIKLESGVTADGNCLLGMFHAPAAIPISKHFLVAGACVSMQTNSDSVSVAAERTFMPALPNPASADLRMRIWVDDSVKSDHPWPKPYFGGLGELAFVGLDSCSSLLIDLRRRLITGRVSPSMAADSDYWRRTIFPILLGIVSPSIGVAPLHCACVARNGKGLLLAGEAGAGKSTLSVALARSGFDFLSDDWTYFSRWEGRWCAWGLPTSAKLLPEAAAFFPELGSWPLSVSLNGEAAYDIDPDVAFKVTRSLRCEPHWIFFLERRPSARFKLKRLSPNTVAARLDQNLRPSRSEALASRQLAVEALSRCECFLLEFGEPPAEVASALLDFVQSSAALSAG